MISTPRNTPPSRPPCAVLLCGGFGTRMGELGTARPKALLPLAGRPLLDYLMSQIVELDQLHGVHLVTNSRFAHEFERWAEPWRTRLDYRGRSLVVHDNGCLDPGHRKGAVGDLAHAIEGAGRPRLALVSGTDNLYFFSLQSLWQASLADENTRVLALHEQDLSALQRSAVLELGAEDRVVAVHEKPSDPTSTWACPALYVLQGQAFDHLRSFLDDGHPADQLGGFVAYLAARQPVTAHRIEGRRLHLTTAESYRLAQRLLVGSEGPAV